MAPKEKEKRKAISISLTKHEQDMLRERPGLRPVAVGLHPPGGQGLPGRGRNGEETEHGTRRGGREINGAN